MDHPAHAHLKAGLEQVPGAHRVDLHGRRIVGRHRTIDAAKMHDHLHPTQSTTQCVGIAQVRHDAVRRRAGVEHPHRVRRQRAHDVVSEPTQPAGDRHLHRTHPIAPIHDR